MKKSYAASLKKTFDLFPQNMILLSLGAIILILPLIATTGQFISVDYFHKTVPILLLFWPGSDFSFSIQVYVWIFMGLAFSSYIAGISYMIHKKTLVKVILLTIIAFICAGLLKSVLTVAFGWHENPLPNVAGKADTLLVAHWHNPIWEEIVFRGLPLLILIGVERYITKNRTKAGILVYLILPAIIFGIYHIPGHGISRFFDSILLGIFFSWLALRYTFFAPVVMHYVADAMIVFNLNKIPSIQPSEITWLNQYGNSLGSFFWLFILMMILLIPVLILYTYKKTSLQEFRVSP